MELNTAVPNETIDLQAAFTTESSKAAMKIPVIHGEVLNISLKEFAALFIVENAPYNYKKWVVVISIIIIIIMIKLLLSFPCLLHSLIIDFIIIIIIITITIIITFRYHESVKDSDVVLSPWDTMSPTLGSTREMKFFKPVNLPGLASTRGVKLQRYKHFEDIGLILYSSTRLEDVPAADTFSVEDVLIVSVCIDIY